MLDGDEVRVGGGCCRRAWSERSVGGMTWCVLCDRFVRIDPRFLRSSTPGCSETPLPLDHLSQRTGRPTNAHSYRASSNNPLPPPRPPNTPSPTSLPSSLSPLASHSAYSQMPRLSQSESPQAHVQDQAPVQAPVCAVPYDMVRVEGVLDGGFSLPRLYYLLQRCFKQQKRMEQQTKHLHVNSIR